VGASIGISIFPDDGTDYESLTKNADVAMYQAKYSGRGVCRFYTQSMNQKTSDRLVLEISMHRALRENEFRLFYQPLVDAESEKIISVEALIRWDHPEFGLISPADFIPIAEETGQITSIGEWVLGEVCDQILRWQEKGINIKISVNLSPRQFRHSTLLEQITRILETKNVPAGLLELEITEGTVLEVSGEAMCILEEVQRLGFSIAIDDFGTGYSSLSYLKRLPVDRLKIDRSFVAGIPEDANDAAISTAIIRLAKSLGLKVVAEGVETQAQKQFLLENECDILQGKLFSMPVDVETLESLFFQ
jgi:EAL domain-containing protein (putative c-di-GMP-specific phosphodiesterase class I)